MELEERETRPKPNLAALFPKWSTRFWVTINSVLGHNQFGLTTSLLRSGLTSLSAIKITAQLHQRLGVAPDVRDMMQNPTILNMENLAALSYAVSRWVQSPDAYLATINSGRSDPRLSNTVGMLVRTLPLKISLGRV